MIQFSTFYPDDHWRILIRSRAKTMPPTALTAPDPITATNSNEAYPQEFSATNGNQFFRLEAVPSAIFNPVFFDADSGGYYTLAVHGSIGNEFIEIDTTSQTQVTPFSLFDTVSGKFYTVSIVGTAENELPVIMPSTSTLANTIYLFNPDVSAYYSLTVNGTAGNEFLTITKI